MRDDGLGALNNPCPFIFITLNNFIWVKLIRDGCHAQISFERKQFKLMDVGSTNGTHVTNEKMSTFKLKKKKNHVLKVGHLVTFGSTTFKWCFAADADAIAEQVQLLPAK